jgi:DNA-binding transcriptional LysR family regulator
MTIRHLQVFIAVCDYGKMSIAAEKLHISQPTVSQAISEIEKYYGIKLFERLSKKLFITEAGESLLDYARHIISLFNEMEENISCDFKNVTLKIGATITVGTCVLNDILNEFQSKFPHIKTKIVVENTGVIEDMILKSEIDIGIVEGVIKSSYIVKTPIIADELILVSSIKHKFSNLNEIHIEELENMDFILREKGSGTREYFEKALEKAKVNINEKWVCNNSEAIKNAVINDHGLTVISKMLVEKELQCKKLHTLLIKDVKLNRKFHIIYHKNKYLSEDLKSFIATCV